MAKLTPKQVIEITYLFKENLIKEGDNTYVFKHGMNDQKIADAVGVTYWHVHNMRKLIYGGAPPANTKPHRTANGTSRLTNLEMRLARIESFMVQDWGYELDPAEKEKK